MKKVLPFLGILVLVVCGVGALALRGFNSSAGAKKVESNGTVVKRGDLTVKVVVTGAVEAIKAVEVKSRVTGRLKQLLVDEGDVVKEGQLIAIIDPKETKLRVDQDEAQLSGAKSAVDKAELEIIQRKMSAQAAFDQARSRVRQLEVELKAQPTLTNTAITQAQTALQTAREERMRLTDSSHPTQRTSAKSSLEEAQANFDTAQLDYQRQQDLEAKGFVSGKTLEGAKLQIDISRSRLNTAKENLAKLDSQLQAELRKANEQIRQSEAELLRAETNRIQDKTKLEEYRSAVAAANQSKAALQDAAIMEQGRQQSMATVRQLSSALSDSERQLGETEIRAPISGVVTKKSLQVGELATGLSTFSSGSTIVKIEDRTGMKVKLDVNEIDTAKLRLGMASKVEIDALPTELFSGKITKIAPASNESAAGAASTDNVVKYQIEIQLYGANPALRSGMSAKCSMNVINHKNVLLIPVEYVGRDGEQSFVSEEPPTKADGKVDPKAVSKKINIVRGAASGSEVEVVSGVSEGTKLVKPVYTGPERKGAMSFGSGD